MMRNLALDLASRRWTLIDSRTPSSRQQSKTSKLLLVISPLSFPVASVEAPKANICYCCPKVKHARRPPVAPFFPTPPCAVHPVFLTSLNFYPDPSLADIDAGVYAGLVLASADGMTGGGADKTVAGKPSSSGSQSTPSGAVKPATATDGSSSRRRLTSLSLRSAGYSDVDVPIITKGSGHALNHHLSKVPTPGSTTHTRSTSSFSSWSVGSMNAPREVKMVLAMYSVLFSEYAHHAHRESLYLPSA